MKQLRILFLVVFSVLFACGVEANDLTPQQKAFQSTLSTFLKEEGFVPTIDSDDNSLNFKKEGVTYTIYIVDSSPFFINFRREGFGTKNADMNAVYKACNEANKIGKCVKTYLSTEKSIIVAVEMYMHSAEEFKYTFYKNIKELDNAYNKLQSSYNEYSGSSASSSEDPFTVKSVRLANVEKDNTIISGFYDPIKSSKTKYLKPQIWVDLKTPGTYDIYYKLYDSTGTLSRGSSSPTGYTSHTEVEMVSGTTFYRLDGWGRDVAGNWPAGSYRVEIYYKDKLMGSNTFVIK